MKITNKFKLPEILTKICEDSSYEPKPNRISVTELNNSIMEIVLKRKMYDSLTEDISDMIPRLFGSAFHKIFEENDVEGDTEEKLEYTFDNGLTLVGKYDKLDGDTLIDYKTTTVSHYKRGDFSDYDRQALCYAWLLRKIKNIFINKYSFYLFLKDYSKLAKNYDASYPQAQLCVYTVNINEMDMIHIDEFINERIELISQYINIDDKDIYTLPLPTDAEKWHTPDTYAVKKIGGKRAIKVCDTEEDAKKVLEEKGPGYEIETRLGRDIKCEYDEVFSTMLNKLKIEKLLKGV